MAILDRSELYQHLDPSGLHERIAGLPGQCWQAWNEGSRFPLPAEYGQANNIVLMGVGGSAIGGDLIAGLAALENGPSVTIVRDYELPSWIGSRTLAIASSYSGDTEETLAMYHQARERKTQLVAVTCGGALGRQARKDGVPIFKIKYNGEPRSALGYSFVTPMAFMSNLGLLFGKEDALEDSVKLLRGLSATLSPDVPQLHNTAKAIAESLHKRLPVIYGAGLLRGVAHRWKTQFNENSKVWAFSEELPELGHNAPEGFAFPQDITEKASVILLHSEFLHSRTSIQYEVTKELLLEQNIPFRQIDGVGSTPLAHLLTTVMLGDYISYYLAMLNQVNPSAVPAIGRFKQLLQRR
ncbi:bifunctional phosphoglucose/phosphomannose isomerase [Dehalococcoidia bacterium]|nr:bifunctional phosphoglucose/phosphomannose isomerase [Dehalococcoidia bacterium]